MVIRNELDGLRRKEPQPVSYEIWCRDLLAAKLRDIPRSTHTTFSTPLEANLVAYKLITTEEYLTEYD